VNLVVGLLDPSAGELSLNGVALAHDPVRYKRQIGYVPEEPFLYTVPQSILIGFSSFVFFTTAGSGLAWGSVIGRPEALVLDAMLLTGVLVLRRRRLLAWHATPLAFEDQLPVEVSPLRLSLD
jgi:hypothetical protein